MAKPRVYIDLDQLQSLIDQGVSRRKLPSILGVSRSAIDARIAENRMTRAPRIQLIEAGQEVAQVMPRRSGPSAEALRMSDPFGRRNLGVSGGSGHVSTLPV